MCGCSEDEEGTKELRRIVSGCERGKVRCEQREKLRADLETFHIEKGCLRRSEKKEGISQNGLLGTLHTEVVRREDVD